VPLFEIEPPARSRRKRSTCALTLAAVSLRNPLGLYYLKIIYVRSMLLRLARARFSARAVERKICSDPFDVPARQGCTKMYCARPSVLYTTHSQPRASLALSSFALFWQGRGSTQERNERVKRMNKQEDSTPNTPADAGEEMRDTGNATTRADETGDVSEANAPTSIKANSGMNTILSGGFGTGTQADASDE
jgi:hypothetical protein